MKLPDLTTWGTFKPKMGAKIGATVRTPAVLSATGHGAGMPSGSQVGLKAHPGKTPVGPPDFKPDQKSNARRA